MSEVLSGAEFKKQLREGRPKLGLFLNSHSPTVAEQLAHSGYDWLLVDSQHGPMSYETLSGMLAGIAAGGAKSLVRVGGYQDRPGMQQALDMLVEDLDPQKIELDSGGDRGLAGMVGSRKARLWDAYIARWHAKARRHEGGMLDVFMDYFAECYDRVGKQKR